MSDLLHPEITIIGCGTPTPLPDFFGSAYVIDVAGEKLLFDCGPATTFKLAKAGLSATDIDTVFFTHHHFDHNADFPTFVLTRWDHSVPSDKLLNVYGPRHTDVFTEGIVDPKEGLWAPDLQARMGRPGSLAKYQAMGGSLPRKAPVAKVTEVGPGVAAEGRGWKVTAARAVHGEPYLDALAYRIDTDHGSVVVTGDTEPCESVTTLATGADVLMMMCWESEEHMAAGGSGATSICGAAQTAADAGVKQLVMVHIGARLTRPDVAEAREAEARAVWDGALVWGHELMTVPWPASSS